MNRLSDWLKRKVRDPLLAELKKGVSPSEIAAAISVSLAIAVNPIIGTTTILCLLAGKVFRLNHLIMQTINYFSYPLQLLLIIPLVRLGEMITGSEKLPLNPTLIIEEFNRSISGFLVKFGMAGLHGLLGWLIAVPPCAFIINFILKKFLSKWMKFKSDQ